MKLNEVGRAAGEVAFFVSFRQTAVVEHFGLGTVWKRTILYSSCFITVI